MKLKYKASLALILVLAMAFLCACSGAPAAVEPETPAQTELSSVTVPENCEVAVADVDEFLAALGSDRTIILAEGTYDLSTAADYGLETDGCYEWVQVYDGFELCINDVSDLTIKGQGDVAVSAIARYANVLHFNNFANVTLSQLILGHTEAQGECVGGVLKLTDGEGAVVNECGLFGCGVVGIDADSCKSVLACGCRIYDCSYAAATADYCEDFRLTDCDIYNCGAYGGSVFAVNNSYGFAALNCDIHDNAVNYLLECGYTQEANLLGCDVSVGNSFAMGMFRISGYDVTVDGCSFTGTTSFPRWYSDEDQMSPAHCVSADGSALTDEQLETMALVKHSFDGFKPKAEKPAVAATVNAEGLNEVHVATVDELLAAIAPDTAIYLDGEYFDLSTASDYGSTGGEYYRWSGCDDGAQLNIVGAENLTIISENDATIAAIPRYVDVLSFTGCKNLQLCGFTAGHTEEPGSCSGGVLRFEGCEGVSIIDCRLYGCGILGIRAFDCRSMSVSQTEIYECSQGAVSISNATDLTFTDCDIHDCAQPELSVSGSNMSYDGAAIDNGFYKMVGGKPEIWTGEESKAQKLERLGIEQNGLAIMYSGSAREDIALFVGDKQVTLTTVQSDDLDAQVKAKWSSADDAVLSVTENADGSCALEVLQAATEGVVLTASYGDSSCQILVYCLPNK